MSDARTDKCNEEYDLGPGQPEPGRVIAESLRGQRRGQRLTLVLDITDDVEDSPALLSDLERFGSAVVTVGPYTLGGTIRKVTR